MKKVAHWVFEGIITLKSGTRIGGSDDILQIGGTDLTCVKDPVTGEPYLPGSSLKGKMRSELEKILGKIVGDEPCGCADKACPVCVVFGPHKKPNHGLGPTRIIVRDAHLVAGGQLESKTENSIKRTTGAAVNPRSLERVVPGSQFRLAIGLQEFDIDRDFRYTEFDEATGQEQPVQGAQALRNVVLHALDLVEASGIGSGVGKGYGEIEISIATDGPRALRRRRPRPDAAPRAS
jgi:CRISPR-associated protein Csm3